MINLDEYENTGTHWVSLFVKPKYTTGSSSLERTVYFDSFGVEHILKGKTLLDYTNLFSPNDFKKNDRAIKRIFKNE